MDFNEWYKTRDTTYVFTHVSDVHLAQLAYKAAFEAGRESVIANRDTFQKVRAEGVREGMKRAAEIVKARKPDKEDAGDYWGCLDEAEKAIRKEIDND